jgi:hypothetical protein
MALWNQPGAPGEDANPNINTFYLAHRHLVLWIAPLRSVTDLILTLLICAVAGGSAFGYILWVVQEKRYRKALDK